MKRTCSRERLLLNIISTRVVFFHAGNKTFFFFGGQGAAGVVVCDTEGQKLLLCRSILSTQPLQPRRTATILGGKHTLRRHSYWKPFTWFTNTHAHRMLYRHLSPPPPPPPPSDKVDTPAEALSSLCIARYSAIACPVSVPSSSTRRRRR